MTEAEQIRAKLYKGYVKEAVENLRKQDLAKDRMKEIKEAVKESKFDTKQFAADVKAVYDLDKAKEQLTTLKKAVELAEEI
jgi:hypothetical protein